MRTGVEWNPSFWNEAKMGILKVNSVNTIPRTQHQHIFLIISLVVLRQDVSWLMRRISACSQVEILTFVSAAWLLFQMRFQPSAFQHIQYLDPLRALFGGLSHGKPAPHSFLSPSLSFERFVSTSPIQVLVLTGDSRRHRYPSSSLYLARKENTECLEWQSSHSAYQEQRLHIFTVMLNYTILQRSLLI